MEKVDKMDIKNDLKTMIHFLKLSHGISKTYIPILFVSSIFKALVPFINIIMPKYIIDELMNEQRVKVFIILVSITILGNFILNLINRWLTTVVEIKNREIVYGFDVLIGEKIVNMDFQNIEDPEILNLKEQALFPLRNQGAVWRMVEGLVNIVSQIISIVLLIGVISQLNIIIVALVLLIVIINNFIQKKSNKIEFKFYQELIPINRKFGYFANLLNDFSIAKDIRLYNIEPILSKKMDEYNKETLFNFSKMFTILGKYEGLNKVNVQGQMLIVYAYIAYKVLKNEIGIGDFTMYTSAAINFSNSISGFFKTYMELRQMCMYLDSYMKLEAIPVKNQNGNKKLNEIKEYNIEFRNVSFKYPKSEDYTLKNISLTINYGEKLSVVGLNGAGKTTFIKLLSRLYTPTEGEILLNGVNIQEYNYTEYMKLLSVVFQDFKLLAFTVKENIALNNSENVSNSEVENALIKSGFKNDLEKLDKGIDTSIYKFFDKDGIEFSGGQSQKLAMARAIYKDAPIVILDEPTAALDPFGEYEIYSKFNELIGEKTAIYISHRLSSCKFCDKIAVFSRGEIVQYGAHEKLVMEKEKEYGQMYAAQAQYYI